MTNLINWKKVGAVSQDLIKKGVKDESIIKIVIKTSTNTVVSHIKFSEYKKLLWKIDQDKTIQMVAVYSSKKSNLPVMLFERKENINNTKVSRALKNFVGYSPSKKDTITTMLLSSFMNSYLIEDKYETK